MFEHGDAHRPSHSGLCQWQHRQPFADLQAETNATERAVHEVSADIRTRLAAYFAKQQPKS